MLLRDALGETLRDARINQNRTLRDVSTSANVSLGYLSEVERGRKEASSELLAAICDALDLQLADVLTTVSRTLKDGVEARRKMEANTSRIKGPAANAPANKELRIVLPYAGRTPARVT